MLCRLSSGGLSSCVGLLRGSAPAVADLSHALTACRRYSGGPQLKALVDVHGQTAGLGGNLSVDEVQVIRGALDLTHKTAINCMTPPGQGAAPGVILVVQLHSTCNRP